MANDVIDGQWMVTVVNIDGMVVTCDCWPVLGISLVDWRLNGTMAPGNLHLLYIKYHTFARLFDTDYSPHPLSPKSWKKSQLGNVSRFG